jgi:hypothetical protein
MLNYIITCIVWILALYGVWEIVKNIIYIHNCNNIKGNGIHLIVGVRNEENSIEAFLRNLNFRILYGKENSIEDIIVIDLNSTDGTKNIVEKISTDFPNIVSLNWKEFEELFSPYLK